MIKISRVGKIYEIAKIHETEDQHEVDKIFKNDKLNKKFCIGRVLRVIKYCVYFLSSIVIVVVL